MYRKFVSNSHKPCVFIEKHNLSSGFNCTQQRETIGPVPCDRQNDNNGAKDFNMKYFMWQYPK